MSTLSSEAQQQERTRAVIAQLVEALELYQRAGVGSSTHMSLQAEAAAAGYRASSAGRAEIARLAAVAEQPKQPESVHLMVGGGEGSYGATAIDTGDFVRHRPSGEEWIVAYVRGDKLSACGWPDTLEDLADCELVKKATPDQRLRMLQTLAGSTGHRAENAKRVLAVEAPSSANQQISPESSAALATQGVQL